MAVVSHQPSLPGSRRPTASTPDVALALGRGSPPAFDVRNTLR